MTFNKKNLETGDIVYLKMRRTIALALVTLFSWTLIASVLAPKADKDIPACCSRAGKHHCMMRGMGQLTGNHKGFTTVAEKCPYCPAGTCAVQSATYKPEAAAGYFAEVVFHPGGAPQTEARSRISFLSSHQKRGPPTPLS